MIQRKPLNQSPGSFWAGQFATADFYDLALSPGLAGAERQAGRQAVWLSGGVAREQTHLTRMHSFLYNSVRFPGGFRQTRKFRLRIKVLLHMTLSASHGFISVLPALHG